MSRLKPDKKWIGYVTVRLPDAMHAEVMKHARWMAGEGEEPNLSLTIRSLIRCGLVEAKEMRGDAK